jgi:hypothetical protein
MQTNRNDGKQWAQIRLSTIQTRETGRVDLPNDAWLQANGFAADPAGKTTATAAAHAIQRDVLSVARDVTVRDAIALLRPLLRVGGRPAPPRIGAGVDAADGWAQLEQRDSAWSIALVLEDGLAIGVISRDPSSRSSPSRATRRD